MLLRYYKVFNSFVLRCKLTRWLPEVIGAVVIAKLFAVTQRGCPCWFKRLTLFVAKAMNHLR
jgi:hypothetical protein